MSAILNTVSSWVEALRASMSVPTNVFYFILTFVLAFLISVLFLYRHITRINSFYTNPPESLYKESMSQNASQKPMPKKKHEADEVNSDEEMDDGGVSLNSLTSPHVLASSANAPSKEPALPTPESIIAHFRDLPDLPELTDCSRLGGGFQNKAWIARLRLPVSSPEFSYWPEKIVVKVYSLDNGAHNRWYNEHTMLTHLPKNITPLTTTPTPLYVSSSPPILITTLAPSTTNLHDYTISNPNSTSTSALTCARFTSSLHSWSLTPAATPLRNLLTSPPHCPYPCSEVWFLWCYSILPVHFTPRDFPTLFPLLPKIQETMLKVCQSTPEQNAVIIWGDPSPRNILGGGASESGQAQATVIDFEHSFVGAAWIEVALSCVELWLVGGDETVKVFVECYLHGMPEKGEKGSAKVVLGTKEEVRFLVCHFCVMAAVWFKEFGCCEGERGTLKAERKRRRLLGTMLEAAWREEWGVLKDGCWGMLVKDEWC